MNRPLIVGYGRAGQRHGKLLRDMGFRPIIVDSDESKDCLLTIEDGCMVGGPDFAIVCTPPDQHLKNIEECFGWGLPVLCEKPLCSFGEIEHANKLLEHPMAKYTRVAYNYRYNPDIDWQRARDEFESESDILVSLIAIQHRVLPSWGIILDHISHDIDLFRAIFGEMIIKSVGGDEKTRCDIVGNFVNGRQAWFTMTDLVKPTPCEREAQIKVGSYSFSMTPNPMMFSGMMNRYINFLDGHVKYAATTLEDAIKTQIVLEDIKGLMNATQ